MAIQKLVNIGAKTSMKIGGLARYFAEISTKENVEEAQRFAKEKNVPLIVLGAGCNTVFADGTIDALVIQVKASEIFFMDDQVTASSGIALASLITACADHDLDLSALTGIPGTLGGAIVGNAGQGPQGTWINSFVVSVSAFVDGAWKYFEPEECDFGYRESVFKTLPQAIVWTVTLRLPSKPKAKILNDIQELMKKRVASQPHRSTAGSCFKAVEGTPAWKLIDAAGLRGLAVGGIQISEKHANFLINADHGTFSDLLSLIKTVRNKVPALDGIEMRLYGEDGRILSV